MPPLIVEEDPGSGDHLLLRLAGEVDRHTVDALRDHLERAVERAQRIVVHLGGVGHVSASGVATLAWYAQLLRGRGGSLVLTGVSRVVRDEIQIFAGDDLLVPPSRSDGD
ncbi:STAS domain-containing protein [Umezawaea beigongshangensis]|uniref:STAS domain-containing protein n=1 Tax=Umezawaea beigongshangensis TaxID=2780383 RepID=UPI0018F10C25|nr:STAS domain-containing protein [Umezawaea beigongshangensis]